MMLAINHSHKSFYFTAKVICILHLSYVIFTRLVLELEAPCAVAVTAATPPSTLPPTITSTAAPTTTTVASTARPARLCALENGYTVLAISFLNYSNPSDFKSTGVFCDTHATVNGTQDNCDLKFEICVSDINTPRYSLLYYYKI